jgi:hypothetical protein
MTGRLWLYIELAARILYELRNMPGSTRVEYWCVGGTTVQYLPMTLGDVSGHLAADWVPSLPAVVGTSFVGWPPFLLESNFSGAHELLGLRAIARRSDRQWKSVLSWMLGVAGARHVLDSEGYRWIAPLSAFYPDAVQPVDLSNWHPIFPPSRVTATAAPGNPSRLRPDYIALRPTSSSSVALGWALVEAKGTRRSLKSLRTCPVSWYEQVHNATILIDNSPISVARHLVVATRINPNALGERARRLQVRAWNQNQQSDLPGLPLDAGIEIEAAHLFGLFSAVGLRQNALAIALSTEARARNRTDRAARDVRYRVSDAADAELRERAARFTNQTQSARFFIETPFGSIEIENLGCRSRPCASIEAFRIPRRRHCAP